MLRTVFLVGLSVFLSGCASQKECETFGVRDSVWKGLTPQQQNIILKSYLRDKEKAEAEAEAKVSAPH
jgi:hypothetical protein